MIRRAQSSSRARRTRSVRQLIVVGIVMAANLFGVPAQAIEPPNPDLGRLPRVGKPAPPDVTEQRHLCAERLLAGGLPTQEAPWAQRIMNLPAAWQFSRGREQRVAVIDTGVYRHERLGVVHAGGDYVSNTDGTDDCDGHGTLVAGIIAARESPKDRFAGVAPEAEIIAIRQLSEFFEKKEQRGDRPPGQNAEGYGDVNTLAAAVVRAVELKATVINISEVACSPASVHIPDEALGAAVKYAYENNVVVVAAAGNKDGNGTCKEQNAGSNPAAPDKPAWPLVQTKVSPAWFVPYVLTVASVDESGAVSDFSINGPWVGVAAPGRNIVSLDRRGDGLVDAEPTEGGGIGSLQGTSFAAPLVAGLLADISIAARDAREKHLGGHIFVA